MTSDSQIPTASSSESKKTTATAWIIIGVVIVVLCICCVVLAALGYWLYSTGQFDLGFLGGGLNPDAAPRSGTISLRAGFLPDPYTATTTSGGSVDVFSQNLGSACRGYAAREPNFSLNWSGASSRMSIFFVSDSGQDTLLLVHTPDGEWLCNDDSDFGGLDPMVDVFGPAVGEYDIWVANLFQGDTGSGTLFVTELAFNPTDPYGSNNNFPPTGGSLDVGAEPIYGETDLRAGFSGDPFTTPVTSGGPVDVYSQNLGDGCLGYAASAPDFRLNWTGSADRLDIFFLSDGDTTLIVNDPNGNWYCNDDSDYSYDPQVAIYGPRQGQYDIWVGSYSAGNTIPGTLYITQDADTYNPGTLEGNLPQEPVGELDPTLEPAYGSTELTAGFSPDPFTLTVTSGSELDVWMMNINAGGYADSAPSYRLFWSGATEQLNIGFVDQGNGDTTLIVLDPEGTYLYNDDSGGTLNPTVRINDPQPGEYNIWVASYHQGQRRTGTLSITDTPAPRPDFTLAPVNGSLNLHGGFSPDPHTVEVTTGGPVDVWSSGIGPCGGYSTAAPTLVVNYSGSASRLRFFFIAEDLGDSTMIIYTPDGEWLCNDDSGFTDRDGNSYNPMINIPNPAAGTYYIWVASYSSGASHPGTLYITGLDRNPSNTP